MHELRDIVAPSVLPDAQKHYTVPYQVSHKSAHHMKGQGELSRLSISCAQRLLTLSCSIFSRCIRVRVGDSPNDINEIHQDLTCEHSQCFENAIKRDWEKAHELCVSLSHGCTEFFEIYRYRLYTRHIAAKLDKNGGSE